MNGAQVYRIADEPQPSAWTRIAVHPLWPLFAFMFAGPWLSWTWFLANGVAVGSPTRVKERLLVVAGLLGCVAIIFIMGLLISSGVVPAAFKWTAPLVLTLWKLGVSYWLFELQRRSFELYRYFGGPLRSGIFIVFAGYLLRPAVRSAIGSGLATLLLL